MFKNVHISIVVVNYNGLKFLKTCLDSLFALDYPDKEIIFIDNASSDNSVEFVTRHFSNIRLIANTKNSGYAGAGNQAVKASSGEYVMILNPDIVFETNYLNILMLHLQKDKKIGAIIGKLLKYNFEDNKKTHIIDSTSLVMFRNRRCVDRGQGEEDRGQYDAAEEVFGITGACPLYRRSALEDVKIAGEYFDSDFFMYKEDVDISWRMQLFGWKCFYGPCAVAYHGRGTDAISRSDLFEIAKNRKNLSKFQKYYSYKNERLMRVKNELWGNVLHDVLHIVWKEILMTGWVIFREPFLLKSFFHFLRQLPNAFRKRKEIMGKTRPGGKEVGKWFV